VESSPNLSVLLNGLIGVMANWTIVRLSDAASVRLSRGPVVTVYMVTKGACRLRAGAHAQADLTIGDVAIVLQSVVQVLACGVGDEPKAFDGDSGRSDIDAPMTQTITRTGGLLPTTVLVGRLMLDWPSALPEPGSFPTILRRRFLGDADPDIEDNARAMEEGAVGPGSQACMTKFAEFLVARAIRETYHSGLMTEHAEGSGVDVRIDQAQRIIRARCEEPWSVATLARAVGMSRSSFAAAFNQLVGQSPMEFVGELRVERAAERMLSDPKLSVTAAAGAVGYVSTTAFARRFQKRFGLRPGAFRRTPPADWVIREVPSRVDWFC
jgi:AraC-like DNA-binding protein